MNTVTLANPLSGVYVLKCADEVLYVGVSKNMVQRVASHHRKSFDSVELRMMSMDDAMIVEAQLIRELQPKLNLTGKQPECALISIRLPRHIRYPLFRLAKMAGQTVPNYVIRKLQELCLE